MSDLESAKAGDKLFVKARLDNGYLTTRVERVTPTGRVITKFGEFNPDGSKRGDTNTWSRTRARIATEDDIAGIYRYGLVHKLESFRLWDKLSAYDLKAASEIIDKYKTER